MSVRIGHASISENGTVNGAKGDQTGREVCIRTFYSRPWDYVAIHPDATVREKHAKAIEAACANDNIGYSQSNRNTLNILAKAAGYDLSKVGKCNCDCSSLQNVAAVASGASGATYGSNGWTTSTMKAALQKLGYKIITDAAYLASSAYCVRGAIYVKASSHTVCALDNGTEYKKTLEKVSISESSGNGGDTARCKVGDIVSFIGTKHYTSVNAASPKSCKPGTAKITAVSAGAKHPYHLVHTDNTSTVYGWVDAGDIGGAASSGGTSGAKMHKVVSGDTLSAIANKNGTTVAKIVAANKSRYPKITANYIVAGWTLTIPQ